MKREMKKYLSILLFTFLLSACVNSDQKIKYLTKEEAVTSLVALDKGEDCYDKKDYANALVHFKRAANFNNPIALYYMGFMYDMGYGVPKDYEMAFKYYKQSADFGYVPAVNNLGIMHNLGLGVEKDKVKACRMFQKAVDAGGSIRSFSNLAFCYEDGLGDFVKDKAKAIKYYKKAIDLGNEDAIYDLASLYDDRGDYEKSFTLFKEASESKDVIVKKRGLYSVGTFYYLGDVVNKDYKKAVEYFNKSAELGYSNAYNKLGIMYEDGIGVKKNYVKALFNYKKAAELKNMYGIYNVARCYDYSIGVKQDINKAIKYYNLSGDLGYSQSYYNLSVIYKTGIGGIKKDYDLAVNYLMKAVRMGNKTAKKVLASVGKYK